MNLVPFRLLAVLLLAPLTVLTAQEKALTPKQAKAAFDMADKALNEAWAAVKKVLGESEFNHLKEDQRTWVEYRDYLARSPLYTGSGGEDELPLTSPDYLEAAAELAKVRTTFLQALAKQEVVETLTGVWSDSYGGHIEILEGDGRIYFVMECVRGPTSHLGGLAGQAAWNRTIGWFSNKGREDGGEGETNVSFVLKGSQLEVTGANTAPYHGVRAYFDGTYVKVAPLDAKSQAKVMKAGKSGELPEE